MLSWSRTIFGCCNFLHIRASRSSFWKSASIDVHGFFFTTVFICVDSVVCSHLLWPIVCCIAYHDFGWSCGDVNNGEKRCTQYNLTSKTKTKQEKTKFSLFKIIQTLNKKNDKDQQQHNGKFILMSRRKVPIDRWTNNSVRFLYVRVGFVCVCVPQASDTSFIHQSIKWPLLAKQPIPNQGR